MQSVLGLAAFQCKFSLQTQTWKFPPLFTPQGNQILPIDNTNNPEVEVVIDHNEVIFYSGKKVNNSPNDSNIVDLYQLGMQQKSCHKILLKALF